MSNIGQKIREDSVGVRWLRTAATTITSTAAAGAVLWGVLSWLVAPRVDVWANKLVDAATEDLQAQGNRNKDQIDRIDTQMDRLARSIQMLATKVDYDASPSWQFDAEHTSISDGRIGGDVIIVASGRKFRECGIPRVDLYFINGSATYHRFIAPSLMTANNRGIALRPDPARVQRISYTATIPANDHVTPGRASGFISVSYPDSCPEVKEVVAGPLQFRILPEEK